MTNWEFLGHPTINEKTNRVKIPDDVFDFGVLDREYDDAHWSYVEDDRLIVLSDRPPKQKDRYRYETNTGVGTQKDGNRATIPKRFFDDYERGNHGPVPEEVRLDYAETLNFVSHPRLLTDSVCSCYVLTDDRLSDVFDEETIRQWGVPGLL